jgi:hypothetical protein
MSTAEWLAIATAAGTAVGAGFTYAAKIIVAVLRELVAGQTKQTEALGDVKLEIVKLGSRVDTLLDVQQARSFRDDEPSAVRNAFTITRGGRKENT